MNSEMKFLISVSADDWFRVTMEIAKERTLEKLCMEVPGLSGLLVDHCNEEVAAHFSAKWAEIVRYLVDFYELEGLDQIVLEDGKIDVYSEKDGMWVFAGTVSELLREIDHENWF